MRAAEASAAETTSKIRGLVLDYGEVICRRPATSQIDRMAGALTMNPESFASHYHLDRALYDQGVTSASDYWTGVACGKVRVTADLLAKLRQWDVEMWSDVDPIMISWLGRLHAGGFKTALLSNMHSDMAAHARKTFKWFDYLDALILSCELQLVKPSTAIYQCCVDKLGLPPAELLFIDDRQSNVDGAERAGLPGLRFESVEQLRTDLAGMRFPLLP